MEYSLSPQPPNHHDRHGSSTVSLSSFFLCCPPPPLSVSHSIASTSWPFSTLAVSHRTSNFVSQPPFSTPRGGPLSRQLRLPNPDLPFCILSLAPSRALRCVAHTSNFPAALPVSLAFISLFSYLFFLLVTSSRRNLVLACPRKSRNTSHHSRQHLSFSLDTSDHLPRDFPCSVADS